MGIQDAIDEKRKGSYSYTPEGLTGTTNIQAAVSLTDQKILRLKREREAIVTYLYAKQQCEDWHAVADAAMDLREIDAKLSILREK